MTFKEMYIVKTKEITALIRFGPMNYSYIPLKHPKTTVFFSSGSIEVGDWPERGQILLTKCENNQHNP